MTRLHRIINNAAWKPSESTIGSQIRNNAGNSILAYHLKCYTSTTLKEEAKLLLFGPYLSQKFQLNVEEVEGD